jgi:2-desacetyl-2-hydroxyethyl bacteriochlorophyllide A dehydrogenase
MRAVICEAPGALRAISVALPGDPALGQALVTIEMAGLCGTDFHIYEGKHPFVAYPLILGHELAGRVVKAAPDVELAPGDAVVINPYLACGTCIACRQNKPNCCVRVEVLGVHRDGGLCEQLVLPAANLYPADGLSTRDAAMVEFLAIGAHAVRRSMARPGARALVRGAGPIGLGVAIFARIAGLAVTMMDTAEERLDFAREKLGFTTLSVGPQLDANITAMTEGFGFDAVFDATGSARSMEAAFSQVAHGGNLILVGIVRGEIAFSDPEFHKREMMLIGSRNATREDFELVMAVIREGLVATDLLATHTTSLDTVADDLRRWAGDKAGLVKAIVEIAGAEQDAVFRTGRNTAGPPA